MRFWADASLLIKTTCELLSLFKMKKKKQKAGRDLTFVFQTRLLSMEVKMRQRLFFKCLLVLTLCIFGATALQAEDFPTKEITIVCHARAGGGSDTFARQLAKYAQEHLGQNIVVVNKKGGRGSNALSYIYRLPADGYTVMTVTPSVLTNWASGAAPIGSEEFIGVTRAQNDMWMIAVHKDSPYNSINELIDDAKKNPGSIQWAGFEIGTDPHMIAYELSKKAAFELEWIPYESGGAIVTALLGKHHQVGITATSVLRPHLEEGSIKPLAVASNVRSNIYPEVPTLEEAGYDVDLTQWRGVIARKGIPQERLDRIYGAFKKAMQEPGWKEYMKNAGMEGIDMTAAEFSASIKEQIESTKVYMKELGITK